jgi:hypothetical protein
MKTTETQYVEKSLDAVLGYFQAGFKPRKGEKIVRYGEPFVDVANGKVLFSIVVEKESKKWFRKLIDELRAKNPKLVEELREILNRQ